MDQKKHFKPLFWGIFSVGGTIAALCLASIICVFCILLPFNVTGNSQTFYENVHGFVSHKLVYIVLSGVIFTFLWHAAHRFYYVMHDFQFHIGNKTRNTFYLFACLALIVSLVVGLR